VPNKTTSLLKDAIVMAAVAVGKDGDGAGGLQGYLEHLAMDEPKAFASLIGRVIPVQVGGDPDSPLQHEITIRVVRPE